MTCKTGQILLFRKNHIDLQRPNPVITITDNVALDNGQDSVIYLRNRDNISGWLTTDSTDAANTEILVEMFDFQNVDFISLIGNNFKNYTIEWRDEFLVWNTYASISANTLTTNSHLKDTPVVTDAIRITITGTQIADADKELRQLIITEKIHQFEGWAKISKPKHSSNRKKNKVISGKVRVVKQRGAFSCQLDIKLTTNSNDLQIHEDLYEYEEGVLLLLSGALPEQFVTQRKGYRDEDIVLVKTIDEYVNPYDMGVYTSGIKVKIKLEESVD